MKRLFRLGLALICILLFTSCQIRQIIWVTEREITASVYQFYSKSKEVCVVIQNRGIDDFINVKFKKWTFRRLGGEKRFLVLPQEKEENEILYTGDRELYRINLDNKYIILATDDKVNWIINARTNEFISEALK